MVCSARLPLARLTRFLAGKRSGQARAPPGREVHQYPKLKNSSCLQPKMPPCDFVPEKYDSYSYEQMLKIRQENVSPSLYTFYKKPLLIHQGHMQWLFDFEGQRYLDFFAGIATVSVGHCHPKVTAAAQKQFGRLGHTSNIYLHPGIQEYTEKLTSLLPGSLKVAYLTNSGTEANDLAVLIARVFTRNTDVIGLRGGYHGGSTYAMGITAIGRYKFGVGNGANCHSTMLPDVFRGPWGGSHCRDSPVQTIRKCSCSSGTCHAKDQYIEQFKDTLQTCVSKKVAAFIAEPIQAQRAIMSSYMMNVMCSMAELSTAASTYLPWVSLHQGINGTVQFPKGFLKEAYQLVRERGGLCIADEVQTGFGRIGSHFWGFQSHDVIPDIVTMAKGIGNGFPMAAVVTTPEIAHSMTENLHFNTFGGNPVACAVGSAVLDAIEEDGLQKNCQEIGTHLLLEFAKLRDMFESVGDVRGKGLMIGIEMVKDKETREPLPAEEMDQIWEDCKDMGLLIGKGGTYLQTFRIKPPMCITKEDADFAVAVFQEALIRHMKRTAEK